VFCSHGTYFDHDAFTHHALHVGLLDASDLQYEALVRLSYRACWAVRWFVSNTMGLVKG